ncbi:MAG TPA: signal peptidase I [Acidimicrobiaceae bacterium]|nr:signal peptidase I [Acidimicrobiaceae bacterium]
MAKRFGVDGAAIVRRRGLLRLHRVSCTLAGWRSVIDVSLKKILSADSWGKTIWGSVREWVLVVVVALLAALVLRATLIQTYYIPSTSMAPTLEVGDRLMVYKLAFSIGDVEKGDLVVFSRPSRLPDSPINDFVKRVVALGGEKVGVTDGDLYIDGSRVDEPYLESSTVTNDFEEVEVPDGHVFVMGDNRQNSRDSRDFGPIQEELLVGEVFLRIWPFNNFGRP